MHSYEYERVNPLISNGNCGDTLYGEHFHSDFLFNRDSARRHSGGDGRWWAVSVKDCSRSAGIYHEHFPYHPLPHPSCYGFTAYEVFGENDFGTECHNSPASYCGSTLYCQNGRVIPKGSGQRCY